jgi:hypothetical protein
VKIIGCDFHPGYRQIAVGEEEGWGFRSSRAETRRRGEEWDQNYRHGNGEKMPG